MLTDLAQEIEIGHTRHPVGVIEQLRGIGGRFKIQQLGELLLHCGDVLLECFACEQIALGGFAAGIANGPGGTAG